MVPPISASIGIASIAAAPSGLNAPDIVLAGVDRAPYRAKHAGGGRIETAMAAGQAASVRGLLEHTG